MFSQFSDGKLEMDTFCLRNALKTLGKNEGYLIHVHVRVYNLRQCEIRFHTYEYINRIKKILIELSGLSTLTLTDN